jgi:hypothetical protein
MLVKIGLIIAAPFITMAAVVGATGMVLVDVQEGGAGGHRIVVPVPLVLAQTALAFAPSEARYIECPEFARYQRVAERVLEELQDIPDCTLVEVHDGSEHVSIRKDGSVLKIDVEDGADETVHVKLPIAGALKAVRGYDGKGFHTQAALSGLRKAPMGTLVDVADGEDHVKIRVF